MTDSHSHEIRQLKQHMTHLQKQYDKLVQSMWRDRQDMWTMITDMQKEQQKQPRG